ncbi:MAG: BMC domain-containing protein [Citrobacter freundii]|nr:BMC domain-containing protein [Citrobacter freundii]
MKQSLGLLEVSGLALAISCADVMAKAASITLVGLEKTNGSGWTAISTGVSFADQRDGLVAHKVISRPGDGILSHSVVLEPEPTPEPIPAIPHEEIFVDHAAPEAPQDAELISCNLCLDPACPRQKGEPRTLCLHSGKRGEA